MRFMMKTSRLLEGKKFTAGAEVRMKIWQKSERIKDRERDGGVGGGVVADSVSAE